MRHGANIVSILSLPAMGVIIFKRCSKDEEDYNDMSQKDKAYLGDWPFQFDIPDGGR